MIALAIAGYMEFLIAGYYNITNPLKSTSGDFIGYYTAYFVVILACIMFPLALVYLQVQRRRDLHRRRIFSVLGELYSGFKTEERMHLIYYFLFGARRVFYIYVVFNWEDSSWAQIMVLEFMNLFMVIYIGQFNPMSRANKNKIELFNEVFVQMITIHMLVFTEWCNRPEQDIMGWSMIAFIVYNIVCNTTGIFATVIHSFNLIFERYKNQVKHYFK